MKWNSGRKSIKKCSKLFFKITSLMCSYNYDVDECWRILCEVMFLLLIVICSLGVQLLLILLLFICLTHFHFDFYVSLFSRWLYFSSFQTSWFQWSYLCCWFCVLFSCCFVYSTWLLKKYVLCHVLVVTTYLLFQMWLASVYVQINSRMSHFNYDQRCLPSVLAAVGKITIFCFDNKVPKIDCVILC